jgi:hypothetical protein
LRAFNEVRAFAISCCCGKNQKDWSPWRGGQNVRLGILISFLIDLLKNRTRVIKMDFYKDSTCELVHNRLRWRSSTIGQKM